MTDTRVSEQFLDAVLDERSFYGPLIKSMAAEVRGWRSVPETDKEGACILCGEHYGRDPSSGSLAESLAEHLDGKGGWRE